MNSLSENEIRTLILDAMSQLNLAREENQQLEISDQSPIFGGSSSLDSLGLVALAMDVEEAFADRGFNLSLSDEKAMSQRNSPFRDVPALVAFIQEMIGAPSDD